MKTRLFTKNDEIILEVQDNDILYEFIESRYPLCSFYKLFEHQYDGIVVGVSNMTPQLREAIFFSCQFQFPNLIVYLYDCKEKDEVVEEIYQLFSEYPVMNASIVLETSEFDNSFYHKCKDKKLKIFVYNIDSDFLLERLSSELKIRILLLNVINQWHLENKGLKKETVKYSDTDGIKNFVKTYRKTKRRFPTKLDK